MVRNSFLFTILLIILGTMGGGLAYHLHLPLPWMLGSLFVTALLCSFFPRSLPQNYKFPQKFRMIFVATVGLMIGAQVTPDLISQFRFVWMSLIGVTLFVPLAFWGNYTIFRRFGQYDPVTAFYSAAPGGLMESIALGEERGCDIKILTTQQFLRIIVVIVLVPTAMSIWLGKPVGSSAGESIASHDVSVPATTIAVSFVAAIVGLYLGRVLKFPASQLTGPLFMAALINLSGIATVALPEIVLIISQLVIGASLGSRFAGLTGTMLVKAMGLSMMSVCLMLSIGGAISFGLIQLSQTPFDVLLISFSPGGIIEMALIALTLGTNPALVSLHHIYRILITIVAMGLVGRRFPKVVAQ